MTKPSVLRDDTILYHPDEPEGRIFPAGSPWPGDAWTPEEDGKEVVQPNEAMAKELKAAKAKVDELTAKMANAQANADAHAGRATEAESKLEAHEQARIAAEDRATEAEARAKGYMTERDDARSQLKEERDAHKKSKKDAEKVPGLVAKVDELSAALAKAKG